MTDSIAIDIRPATGNDEAWIFSSWLQSYREHGSGVGRIPREVYWAHHRPIVQRLTAKPGCATLVACPGDNSEQILGWLCGELVGNEARLYYGHVKSVYRRQGIMRALLSALGVTPETRVSYAHHTKLSWVDSNHLRTAHLSSVVPLAWQFNPYILNEAR